MEISEEDEDYEEEEIKRGIHNWRNLFRKPTLLEWTILFMLLMVLFMVWAYQRDTALCRETLKEIRTNPCQYCNIGEGTKPLTADLDTKEILKEDGET